jgi:hypothetical protein
MTTWHASDDVLARFAREPEAIDPPSGSSIELHLVSCASCRAAVARHADRLMLDASWQEIEDRIDAPRPRLTERLLRAIGLAHGDARVVAATPALQWAWFVSLFALVAGVIGVAREVDDPGPLLVVAPLIPLAAVALVFWPGADPAGEAGRVTPLAGLALTLRRAITVLVPSVAVVLIGALAAPGVDAAAAAWLLPALALCALSIAFSTWVRVEAAAATLAAGWLGAVVVLHARQDLPVRDLALFTPRAQAVWLATSAVAIAVVAVRRGSFTYAGRSS